MNSVVFPTFVFPMIAMVTKDIGTQIMFNSESIRILCNKQHFHIGFGKAEASMFGGSETELELQPEHRFLSGAPATLYK